MTPLVTEHVFPGVSRGISLHEITWNFFFLMLYVVIYEKLIAIKADSEVSVLVFASASSHIGSQVA